MKNALIVIDMQNDFITGPLGSEDAQAIVPAIVKRIRSGFYDDIFATRDTHKDNYMDTLEGKKLPVPHCIKGTPGHYINDSVFKAYVNVMNSYKDPYDIYPLADMKTLRIEKPTFGSIELQNILYTINDIEKVEEITLIGLCTGICVLSNSILAKATLPEAEVNVVADCCACVTPESHKTALEAMKLCQINII
jgi:nicotinamidase-related amidase